MKIKFNIKDNIIECIETDEVNINDIEHLSFTIFTDVFKLDYAVVKELKDFIFNKNEYDIVNKYLSLDDYSYFELKFEIENLDLVADEKSIINFNYKGNPVDFNTVINVLLCFTSYDYKDYLSKHKIIFLDILKNM